MDTITLWLIDMLHIFSAVVHEWPGTTALLLGLWLYWIILRVP